MCVFFGKCFCFLCGLLFVLRGKEKGYGMIEYWCLRVIIYVYDVKDDMVYNNYNYIGVYESMLVLGLSYLNVMFSCRFFRMVFGLRC